MDQIDDRTAIRLIAFVCTAQVLVQIGAFFWPALVPEMMLRWRLTNSEAGWITAAFYGAYMLAVPVLVTLTDRVQEITGTVQDALGRPTSDYTIILFPADNRYWVPQSRRDPRQMTNSPTEPVVPGQRGQN